MNHFERQYKFRFSAIQGGSDLFMLIALHLVVFVAFAFIKMIYYFNHGNPEGLILYNTTVLPWFVLSSDVHTILSRPWTILTHMFMHDNIWHVLANMLWLWGFGYLLQNVMGRKVIAVFIYGALAGALAFVLAFNFIPALKPEVQAATALGASAGVMAIAVAVTLMTPGFRLFPMLGGGIPLWVLTMLYIIIDLATIPFSNPGGHIAHLAGAFMGFIFIAFYKKGYDGSNWMNQFFDWVNNLFNPDKPKKGKGIKEEIFYKATSAPYKKSYHLTQQRIDEILDKISQKGYDSLTAEEKDLLKRASKEEL
jgi:membrane associated rhomboid family serine protease